MTPLIYVLATGGTIAERSTRDGAVLTKTAVRDLLSSLDLKINIQFQDLMQKGSANIVPDDWMEIARNIVTAMDAGATGIVVLHGTDTIHYTASALSFMLQDPGVPVVLTGSMLPGADSGSDSFFNLQNAITVAAFGNLAEVCIVFSADSKKSRGVIIRGSRARKMSSSAINAFDSINIQPIGYVVNDSIVYTDVETRKRGNREVKLLTKLDKNVVVVKQNPALTASFLTRMLSGASGAVIEGTGAGHVIADLIKVIASFKKPVVMSTQAIYGGVKWGIYALDRSYQDVKNFIPGGDMTPETALVKLMWALGQGGDVRSVMLKNIAGELEEPGN